AGFWVLSVQLVALNVPEPFALQVIVWPFWLWFSLACRVIVVPTAAEAGELVLLQPVWQVTVEAGASVNFACAVQFVCGPLAVARKVIFRALFSVCKASKANAPDASAL